MTTAIPNSDPDAGSGIVAIQASVWPEGLVPLPMIVMPSAAMPRA
jgi:hypothetical protein